jgi:prepilin-type N-terminal cleavage/methylation domain-containing protein
MKVKGFTLLELTVAIGLFSILTFVAYNGYLSAEKLIIKNQKTKAEQLNFLKQLSRVYADYFKYTSVIMPPTGLSQETNLLCYYTLTNGLSYRRVQGARIDSTDIVFLNVDKDEELQLVFSSETYTDTFLFYLPPVFGF